MTTRTSHHQAAITPVRRKTEFTGEEWQKAGGQKGHEGCALSQREKPDYVVNHYPAGCESCQQQLNDCHSQGYQKRQVLDLPPTALEVTEHRAHWVKCPGCQHLNQASFPKSVPNWMQYRLFASKARAFYKLCLKPLW